jgi:hypothetical protein
MFADIADDYAYVSTKLLEIVKDCHKEGCSFDFSNSICAHVRLGDFKIGSQTTNISWFVAAVREVRATLRHNAQVFVFSDGNDDDLRPLLALDNVTRLSFGSSIADMLALSNSKILIASKNSTFGMWACYIGRMPVIFPEGGGCQQQIHSEDSHRQIYWNGYDAFPDGFIVSCRHSVGQGVSNP